MVLRNAQPCGHRSLQTRAPEPTPSEHDIGSTQQQAAQHSPGTASKGNEKAWPTYTPGSSGARPGAPARRRCMTSRSSSSLASQADDYTNEVDTHPTTRTELDVQQEAEIATTAKITVGERIRRRMATTAPQYTQSEPDNKFGCSTDMGQPTERRAFPAQLKRGKEEEQGAGPRN